MQTERAISGMHPRRKTLVGMSSEDNRSCSTSLSWSSETPLLQALSIGEKQISLSTANKTLNILYDVVYGNIEFPTTIKDSVVRAPSKSSDRNTNCPVKTSILNNANDDEENKNTRGSTGNAGNGQVVDLVNKPLRPAPHVVIVNSVGTLSDLVQSDGLMLNVLSYRFYILYFSSVCLLVISFIPFAFESLKSLCCSDLLLALCLECLCNGVLALISLS